LLALLVVNLLTLAGIVSTRRGVNHMRAVQRALLRTRAALVDAETGQRGYLLTGNPAYLEPLRNAGELVSSNIEEVTRLTASDPRQRKRIAELEQIAADKLEELQATVALYQLGDMPAALGAIRTGRGKALMDRARQLIDELRARDEQQLEQRTGGARRHLRLAMWIDAGGGIGLVLLGVMLFFISRDLARRDELERALREAIALHEQFIGILGHDLRNPIAAIAMGAEVLEKKGYDKPLATRIASSADRMGRMVDQLLDLTRARKGGGIPVARARATNLRDLLSSVVDELRVAHPEARIDLRVDDPAIGAWDPDRMAQVISNLVGNALEHGAGAPIEVRLASASEEARLTVHNRGPAIPADLLPHIFDPFRRGPQNGHPRGLGLGLFITAEIVRAHGGTISVRSTDREGTTFSVILPGGYSTSHHQISIS
jgi:signal transduction histidine kinase